MLIDTFLRRGQEFLGCRYPIMCGAMTWISDYRLVGNIGNADGFGFLAGGNTPVKALEEEITAVREHSDKPFGVNLITVSPIYKDQLNMVCDMKCDIIMFAGSIPREPEIQKAQDSGAKIICFAPTAPLAMRLIKMGTDALMLEGSEAGGHIGPVTLSVLLQEVLFKIDSVPIFVAGGIATGRMMAHLLMMGAAGIQMGTRFVMSDECKAHPDFKETFRKAKAKDAVATPQFDSRLPVIPVRALKNKGTATFGKLQLDVINRLDRGTIDPQQAQFEVENFWAGALREAAIEGKVHSGSLMAGQSVGLADKVMPIKDIIAELVQDAESELQRLHEVFHTSCI
ncbi:MAG: nitronate monooxygenase [Deltaproteobacteria bacterium]|jgi:enoyl-[acyl-carrier protein] reductase II|nr:nitronate monooxygenase [Deltaproteobacteria bacterium]